MISRDKFKVTFYLQLKAIVLGMSNLPSWAVSIIVSID